MRFAECSQPGGPEVLRLSEMPTPTPGDGEIVIKVHAAGVNRPDLLQRKGAYPPPPGASPILGLEVAGEVTAVGANVSLKIGDHVCALTPGGGYAEYCLVPASHCLPIPHGLSMEEAAGIPETFFTVWTNVFQIGRLEKGESFLVHGGSSGIGTTAIQLARSFGAKVFATAGTTEKCNACEKFGAKAINYKTQDFVAEIKALTGNQGVNLILDMVGGDYTPKNIECLAVGGRIVQIAVQKGSEVQINLMKLMQKRALLTGSTLRPRSIEDKARIAKELHKNVWPLLEAKKVSVQIDRVFPFNEVANAHKHLEAGETIGKVILKLI